MAETEHDARRWLASNAGWDVAIVDLFLREGQRPERRWRPHAQRNPGQQVIVLSNHSSRDVRWRCAQLGADAVFDKSTELEALIDYCLRRADPRLPRKAHPEAAA
jgi:DNA-binding NarL/FixJ family response regulator